MDGKIEVLFRAKNGSYDARGLFDGKGIKVLKGSLIGTSSNKGAAFSSKELDENNRLKEDVYFNSPSSAAVFVCGRSANGWKEWRDLSGEFISIYRDSTTNEESRITKEEREYLETVENDRERAWVFLFFGGDSAEEIAKEYKRPLSQVRVTLSKHRDRYSAFLKEKRQAPEKTDAFLKSIPSKDKRIRAYKALKKKINKFFDKKFFVGDITVNDEEYDVLKDYVKGKIRKVNINSLPETDDPILAVALVQLGIRRYADGNFWGKVLKDELNVNSSISYQSFLGESFVNTLLAHGKYVPAKNEKVQAILFHSFVTDYYSKGLFELLFQYYSRDLERDINRNDRDQMQALMSTLQTEAEMDEKESEKLTSRFMAKGSRAYKLRKHTLQAISANPTHGSLRLRRILRLMDMAFWKSVVPKNPKSRLTILFLDWMKDSPSFKDEYDLFKSGQIRNRGKKHFSAPYLFADLKNTIFSIKLPPQIVKEETSHFWSVSVGEFAERVPTDVYPVLTGFKTIEQQITIPKELIFSEISCTLCDESGAVKRFPNIPPFSYRFFDTEGDFSQRLFKIPMVAYSESDSDLVSTAINEKKYLGALNRWTFDFENGDIVIFPDGRSMVVGERYTEGLLQRDRVENAVIEASDGQLPVYRGIPRLLLTIAEEKLTGTLISVNRTRHKLSECEIIKFSSGDSAGMKAFLVDLAQFGECRENEVNDIYIEVPGAKSGSLYRFAYIKDLSLTFEGEPYIFESKGTLLCSPNTSVECLNGITEKISGENAFSFEIDANMQIMHLRINGRTDVAVTAPIVMWSWDKKSWFTERMGDIWHSEFNSHSFLYFRSPEKKLSLTIDEGFDDDEEERRLVECENISDDSGNICRIDLTRFKTWINREKIAHTVLLKVGHVYKEFAKVYAKSFIVSCDLSADYDEGVMICSADIVGYGSYFVDIRHIQSDSLIIEKGRLSDGVLRFKDKLANGDYSVFFYEKDDSGDDFFDEDLYHPIHEFSKKLVNKNDLSGNTIELKGYKRRYHSNLYYYFGEKLTISLKERSEPLTYTGILALPDTGETEVRVRFLSADDLRLFELLFRVEDDDDWNFFLYDSVNRKLVQDEEPGINRRERYRRYTALFDDDFVFYGIIQK